MDFLESINQKLKSKIKYPVPIIFAAGVLLVAIFGWVWWQDVYQSPSNVFWSMISKDLSTRSVTKVASQQASGSQLAQSTLLQLINPKLVSQSVALKQSDGTQIVTESIGTPNTGYIRYSKVTTPQKNKQGKPFDFSSILNVWGKTTDSNSSLTHLYNTGLVDVLESAPLPPIGDLNSDQKSTLLNYMHQNRVFEVNFKNVKHQKVNGHQALVYSVQVTPGAYLQMIKSFANDVGVHDLDNQDPNSYSNSQPLSLTLSVDPKTHTILSADYPANKYSVTYSNFNAPSNIKIPSKTIALSDLQNRLNQLQPK